MLSMSASGVWRTLPLQPAFWMEETSPQQSDRIVPRFDIYSHLRAPITTTAQLVHQNRGWTYYWRWPPLGWEHRRPPHRGQRRRSHRGHRHHWAAMGPAYLKLLRGRIKPRDPHQCISPKPEADQPRMATQ